MCFSHSLNFLVQGRPESPSKHPTKLIVELNSSLRHMIVTQAVLSQGMDLLVVLEN